MSFPLLRLPLLASINVIKKIRITEIINLIQTSSKVQQLVKISKYPVHLHVSPKSITLKQPMKPRELQVLIVVRPELEEHQERIRFQQNQDQGVFTEWKDEMEGYRRIIDFLVGNFTVKCISFYKRAHDPEVFVEYLEYSKSRGIKFDRVCICESSHNGAIVDRILSVCFNAASFDLVVKHARFLTFNAFHEFKMGLFDFSLAHEEWFSADHMCALINCSHVRVQSLRHWKAEDFNKFLKFWIKSTGRLRKVRFFAWGFDFDRRIAMNGINYIELRPFSTFKIQSDDGRKAIVEFSDNQFLLYLIDD